MSNMLYTIADANGRPIVDQDSDGRKFVPIFRTEIEGEMYILSLEGTQSPIFSPFLTVIPFSEDMLR